MTISLRRTMVVVLAGLVALGQLSVFAAPSTDITAVKGRVFASDLRTPVPGLQIQAVPQGAEEAVARVMTDQRGRFTLSDLPAGKYTLVLYDEQGSALATAPINAQAGHGNDIALALPAVSPGESAAAPAASKAAAWLTTPAGATVALTTTALIFAVVADDVSGSNPSRKDLPPPSQDEP